MTTNTETDTYGYFGKKSATGGILMHGFVGTDTSWGGLHLKGTTYDAANTTKTSGGGLGVIQLDASIKSGTTTGACGSDGNLVVIANNGTARFIFDAEGDSHQDVGTAWTNFDNEPDALICRSAGIVMDQSSIVKSKFDDWGRDHKEDLIRTGLIQRLTPEQEADGEQPLMNTTQLARLHNGAIWQAHVERQEMKEELAELRQENIKLASRLNLLEN
jgi:hypothetical protein